MKARFTVILALGLCAAATAAQAQNRPDSRAMSCGQVQTLIEQRGAVVLTTGRHTYDRYVAGFGYCSAPYEPALTYIPAADTPQCPVYECRRQLRFFDD